jgi:putative DNA primase/helicase
MTAGANLLDTALVAHAAGLAVLPPKEDGSKAPITNGQGEWAVKIKRPSETQIRAWYGPRTGLGALGGRISGGLEALDFDLRHVCGAFVGAGEDWGIANLIARIRTGYDELTPNGEHWLYLCTETGCVKLAWRPAPTPEDPNGRKALIETKGEGGYVILAPSCGGVHPTGRPYELVSGGFSTIATITPAERQALFALARSFDEMPQPKQQATRPLHSIHQFGERPGDVLSTRTSWPEILGPQGWTQVYERAGISYWRRPGKTHGISATVNATGRDSFICFSTSTPFDIAPVSYSRFGAFALLEHGGDFRAAAADLAGRYNLSHRAPYPSRVVSIDRIDPSVLKRHFE